MKAYVINYTAHAGKWIYKGYQRAWLNHGYDLVLPDATRVARDGAAAVGGDPTSLETTSWGCMYPNDQETLNEGYIIMTTDDVIKPENIPAIEKSYKTFVFAQPQSFPEPWGPHPNFISQAKPEMVKILNEIDNVYLWTFADVNPRNHHQWKKVHTVPLAFDNIGYQPQCIKKYTQFDISFIGGWANNGFNEKRKIMVDIFSEFMKSGLKCGFFVNKNLSHQQECDILANSKLTLNIHDAYQRILGCDTNERTFKSLGLNGCLISDPVDQLGRFFPEVKASLEPSKLVKITKEYLALSEKELRDIKEQNKQNILDNHCYTHRVEQLLKLENE